MTDKKIKAAAPAIIERHELAQPAAMGVPNQELAITPEQLISQGMAQGIQVETMERLLAMRRELRAEKAKEEYDKAMARFQSQCPTIKKTKEVKTKNGIVAYRYAPIESIVEQVKTLLMKNGFSYSTGMEVVTGGVKATVTVKHSAGHSEQSSMEVPLGNKTDIMSQSQVVAAAQTFAKRYAFCNAFGLLTGDDDVDGKAPGGKLQAEKTADNFAKAKQMVASCQNSDVLLEYVEKLKSGSSFTKAQKDELNQLISRRIDHLDNAQN